MMEDCLHTSSENLSKLVRWAHSHGTICALIPNLQHLLTEGSHGNLTAMWGCSAGHAYHWPLPATCKTGIKERGTCYQDSRSIHSDSLSLQGGASAHQSSPGGERFLTRTSKAKGGDSSQTRDSCDFSNCSDDNTEADDNTEEYNSNLFDIVCESSATDEDGDVDYEPHHRPRKRATQGGMPGPQRPGSEDRAQGDKPVKRIKQETAEDYYTVANAQLAAAAGTNSGLTSHSSQSPKPNNPQPRMPQPGLPPKPTQLDADSLGGGVGGVASSLLGLGRSSPHIPMLAKPLRGSVSGSVLKPSAMNSGSPRHQDSSSGSTQGLSTLTGAAGEMIEGLTSEDLLKPGGTEGPFGDLTPSSPIGMNSDLDLMAAHDLGADTKEEATVLTDLAERERLEEAEAAIRLEQNEKTIRSTQTALRNFRDFLVSKYPTECREIYYLPCSTLDSYLASFFRDARQKDGSEYEPNSLANYQCGLERYLKEQRYSYSITKDKEFRLSQEALKQKQLELKFKGKGNKPHKSMKLTFSDELILRKRGLLSRFNPEGLLNLVWLNNTKAFGHCTGFHGSSLKWGDVHLLTTANGLECLEWTYQDFSDITAKNRRPVTECRIYAMPHSPQTCPVQDYKEYAQRRPQAMLYDDAPFYLSIKPVVNLAALYWYNCQALGKNKLAKMVKTMCEKGNIPGRKTNFSVYQSCSSLSEAQSNQLVLICNNLSQQASQSLGGSHSATNFLITGSFDSSDTM
ncbi:uncharacterized protein KIAA1958 homolog isoform X5 [Esox lucius]|uniref:Si:ch211-126i22.5 n=2 Tax=Esox lucius TaxID=8010 RepID=A0A3P9A2S3_ESOLU|nr:uncharacterized protein KIAA1958 homolog isoform X5 [Esox lucius]